MTRLERKGRKVLASWQQGKTTNKLPDQTLELPAKVQSLAAELKRMARAVAPGGQVSSGQADLAWQAAVLLPRKAKARFDRAVRRFAQASNQAYRIEVTGPWPPYSFVRHGR